MKTIYKYTLNPNERHITLPVGWTQLHVGAQHSHASERIYLWALVDPAADPVDVPYRIVATGEELADDFQDHWDYQGTAFLSNGLVFHLFTGV